MNFVNDNCKSIRFKNSEAGFLLLDAVVFTIFLSMIAFAMSFYQYSVKMRRNDQLKIAAVYIAQTQMSNIKSRIAAGNESIPDNYLGENKDLLQFDTMFEVETEIEDEIEFSNEYDIQLKTIYVTVKYDDQIISFKQIVHKK